ncbi:epoxide hydrolase [Phenylobacterium sp. Root77]|jgi:pimeloyl-ACP methyl ester carboxylesterase|uniref:alpha/beta fold hydrolase n=1 Tax=unclassified Phenylobacterium TaxID=2640670 RepID=UPI0006F1CBCA|nr:MULTISPECIES: alpha/beta hydrolase [unclassified Phenylobacterium]KQW72144.1 epoxide hydrolase [Phenylobacterium sp. Root1277]KQW95064.1 epoxide hydrolase [Phenylobacterium sp. Root1290]KRC44757.1 epoxide hydrolase [Phenylobacterium sp. Root77]
MSSALARQMPPVQHAKVNGIDMAYYEVGPRGQGVPLIFCHGFPELAFSWRHQLAACEAAGVWAIAPDQRGYGLSSRPEAVTDYDMEHLTGDLVGLLDHLGAAKGVFVGHDWGGIVVWQLPLMHPDRVAGIIGLNTPFMRRAPLDPIEGMRKVFGEDMYIVWFQKPAIADAALAADVDKTMRFFMRKPAAVEQAAAPPAGGSTFAFGDALKAWDKSDTANQLLNADELAAFVETFEASGFTGGINWYRNFSRNWERSADFPTRIDGIPCLMIMAEKDVVLSPAMADGMEDVIGDLEKVLIKDSGHWTQQEKPEEVNRLILDWMERRFPK